jgi:hypothetical protein
LSYSKEFWFQVKISHQQNSRDVTKRFILFQFNLRTSELKTTNTKMKKQISTLTLCGAVLALATIPARAGVSLSIDSTTTQASTSWSASPAGTLAQSIDTPNLQNSQDGGLSSGVIFKAGSSFTLGAVEIDEAFLTGAGNFNLVLYDLGSSYSLPGTSPVYTFTGTETDLLGADNVTLTSHNQFDVFTFSGADNVSMTSGDSYWFGLEATDGTVLTWERGAITANQDIAVNSVVVGGAGTVLNNGGTGANRTPIAAFFAAPVPEPTSLALVGLGLAFFGVTRRSRK